MFDQNSFYGANKETVCSLLLSILPKLGHQYKPLKCSISGGSSSNKVSLLQNVVKYLHESGGFCYMEVSKPITTDCTVYISRPACAWFIEIVFVHNAGMYEYVYVCVYSLGE